ncbi:flagellar protein FliS, partial [Butyricicoccus sp. 1XD8-22]
RLLEANLKNDTTIIDEVIGLTTEFRDTWKQVIQITRQQQFSNSQQV